MSHFVDLTRTRHILTLISTGKGGNHHHFRRVETELNFGGRDTAQKKRKLGGGHPTYSLDEYY